MFVILWHLAGHGDVFASRITDWTTHPDLPGVLQFKTWREAKDYISTNPFPATARIVQI